MLNVQQYMPAIQDACKSFGVTELYLFGSALTESFGEDSDVDVLASFAPGKGIFMRFMGFKERLEEIFGRKVDVVMPEGIRNPIFEEEVMSTRRQVYAA